MTEETIPSFLLKTPEMPAPDSRATELGAMLLAAVAEATKPLMNRIAELEELAEALAADFHRFESDFEDTVEKQIESALESLEVEVSAEIQTNSRRYR